MINDSNLSAYVAELTKEHTPPTEQAFVYIWKNKHDDTWYIGRRTQKKCHPNDGYICSSKYAKPLIVEHPDDWERKLIYVGTPENAKEIEEQILIEFNAARNYKSLNRSNGDRKFDTTGIAGWNKGKFGYKIQRTCWVKCPHCNKLGRPGHLMNKYHFDNCLKNPINIENKTDILQERKINHNWYGKKHLDTTTSKMSNSCKTKNAVIINGKEYDSFKSAGLDLNIDCRTIAKRVRSPNFEHYLYADNTKNVHKVPGAKPGQLTAEGKLKRYDPVIIENIEYPSINHAARALGFSLGKTYSRINSPNYPTYQYKKES